VNKFSLVSLLCFAAAGACAVACSSDEDTGPVSGAGAGGKGGTGGKGGAGGTAASAGKGGAGGTAGGVAAGAGGEGGAIESTLYSRLGEHAGIRAAVDAIVAEEVKDPIIASYFSQLAVKGHEPNVDQISECLTFQLANAADGPEAYPVALGDDYNNYVCRSMTAAHSTLGIGAGTFDKFVSIAAGVLNTTDLSDADKAAVGAVLNGTKAQIVDKNVPSGEAACMTPASCALPIPPGDGGAGGESSEGGAGGAAGATL